MCILLDIFPTEVPMARFPVAELEVRRILYGHSQPNPAEIRRHLLHPIRNAVMLLTITAIMLAVTGGGTLGCALAAPAVGPAAPADDKAIAPFVNEATQLVVRIDLDRGGLDAVEELLVRAVPSSASARCMPASQDATD